MAVCLTGQSFTILYVSVTISPIIDHFLDKLWYNNKYTLKITSLYLVCTWEGFSAVEHACVEGRGQFAGTGSLLPPCRVWCSNSGLQTWWQAPSSTKSPGQPHVLFLSPVPDTALKTQNISCCFVVVVDPKKPP